MDHGKPKNQTMATTTPTSTTSVTDNKQMQSHNSNNVGGGERSGYAALPKSLLLTRGFSKVKANEDILAEARTRIESNLVAVKESTSSLTSSVHVLNELSYFSFALPNLNRFDDDYKFKGRLFRDTTGSSAELSPYFCINKK